MDDKREPAPEHPHPMHTSLAGGAAPPPEHTQHDVDRIAAERSREDEAVREQPRGSWWRRLFHRRR